MRSRNLWLLLWMLVFTASTQAELFKWVDEQGRTHYSDSPPTGDLRSLEYRAPADNRIAPPANIKPRRKTVKSKRYKKRTRKRQNCDKYQIRIDKVQRQLRAGYKAAKGNKLRARRRELNEQLRQCKKG